MGDDGQDFIFLGTDMGSEVFAGTGNDFIYGNKNAERILGNEGDDWIETGTFDGAPGDNFDEIFAHDGIDGNDVFLGDGGFDEFIGEGGDDIMVGSAGRGKMAGMSGFDWATYKDNHFGVNADLSISDRLRRSADSAAERGARRIRVDGRSFGHRVQRRPEGHQHAGGRAPSRRAGRQRRLSRQRARRPEASRSSQGLQRGAWEQASRPSSPATSSSVATAAT